MAVNKGKWLDTFYAPSPPCSFFIPLSMAQVNQNLTWRIEGGIRLLPQQKYNAANCHRGSSQRQQLAQLYTLLSSPVPRSPPFLFQVGMDVEEQKTMVGKKKVLDVGREVCEEGNFFLLFCNFLLSEALQSTNFLSVLPPRHPLAVSETLEHYLQTCDERWASRTGSSKWHLTARKSPPIVKCRRRLLHCKLQSVSAIFGTV